jgi:hypothetical protein
VAEGALVGEAQVWAAVGEREAGADVRVERTVGVADQELAAHPQVREQRFLRGVRGGAPPGDIARFRARYGGGFCRRGRNRAIVEGEPEVLAAPFGAQERAACHRGGEPVWSRKVAAHRPRVHDLGRGDRAAHDVLLNPGADGLDLGQFWHHDLRSGLANAVRPPGECAGDAAITTATAH